MATKHYQIEIDKDLKIPLKTLVVQESTSVKAWVSALIRKALEEQEHCNERREAA